jgi:hypothetical protein
MTELEAVNTMLSVVGEAPVNTLESSGLGDVAVAQQVLLETSREVQERGWSFNRESGITLSPNTSGNIAVPPNVLRLDTLREEAMHVTQRGTRLYDRENHTYSFSRPVKCEITFMLDFQDLPHAAKHYITIRAARRFQKRVLGSDRLDAFTEDDEMFALASLKDQDSDVGHYNILTGNPNTAYIHMR